MTAATAVALPRRTRWLADDLTRSWLTLPLLVGAGLLATWAPVAEDDAVLARLLAVYCALLLAYPALTLLAFSGLAGDRLSVALGEARRRQLRRPRWVRRLVSWRDDDVGGDGPSWPVVLALVALVIAIWLVVSDPVHCSSAGRSTPSSSPRSSPSSSACAERRRGGTQRPKRNGIGIPPQQHTPWTSVDASRLAAW